MYHACILYAFVPICAYGCAYVLICAHIVLLRDLAAKNTHTYEQYEHIWTNITKKMHEYKVCICAYCMYLLICVYIFMFWKFTKKHSACICMYLSVSICICLYDRDWIYLYHTLEYGSDQLIYCFNTRQPGSLWAKSWPTSWCRAACWPIPAQKWCSDSQSW